MTALKEAVSALRQKYAKQILLVTQVQALK